MKQIFVKLRHLTYLFIFYTEKLKGKVYTIKKLSQIKIKNNQKKIKFRLIFYNIFVCFDFFNDKYNKN